jgi:hypothetical protein
MTGHAQALLSCAKKAVQYRCDGAGLRCRWPVAAVPLATKTLFFALYKRLVKVVHL